MTGIRYLLNFHVCIVYFTLVYSSLKNSSPGRCIYRLHLHQMWFSRRFSLNFMSFINIQCIIWLDTAMQWIELNWMQMVILFVFTFQQLMNNQISTYIIICKSTNLNEWRRWDWMNLRVNSLTYVSVKEHPLASSKATIEWFFVMWRGRTHAPHTNTVKLIHWESFASNYSTKLIILMETQIKKRNHVNHAKWNRIKWM